MPLNKRNQTNPNCPSSSVKTKVECCSVCDYSDFQVTDCSATRNLSSGITTFHPRLRGGLVEGVLLLGRDLLGLFNYLRPIYIYIYIYIYIVETNFATTVCLLLHLSNFWEYFSFPDVKFHYHFKEVILVCCYRW